MIPSTQVKRFIRLTNLIPELLDMVDEKKMCLLIPLWSLSYLAPESQQREFFRGNERHPELHCPFPKRSGIKKLAQEGHFYSMTLPLLSWEKRRKDELDKVVIKNDTLKKYFPRSYTPKQMEDTIIKLLEQWQRKQQRQNER